MAVRPIRESPIPTSMDPGSGTFPRAPAPIVITAKVGEAYYQHGIRNLAIDLMAYIFEKGKYIPDSPYETSSENSKKHPDRYHNPPAQAHTRAQSLGSWSRDDVGG